MKFLIGCEKDFFDFFDSIKPGDRVGILTHIDLDGIASAIFLEKILESKQIKLEFIDFLEYGAGMFQNSSIKLNEKGITKLFILDLNADVAEADGFENLRKEFDVFFIDHHPISENLKDYKNILKSESSDCVTLVLNYLAKDYFDVDFLYWLICPTIVAEWSFRKKEYMDILEKDYPGITKETLYNFSCGKIARKINSALIYYKDNIKKVYDLIKEKDLKSFDEVDKIVQDEIDFCVEKFKKEAEFYPEKNLYFYYYTPKYNVMSTVVTILSDGNGIFLFASDIDDDKIKISARNNTTDDEVNLLIRKGILGLENSTGGGHKRAASGTILKKDLAKFKENLLKS